MPWRRYREMHLNETIKQIDPQAYSITADVLSFRRCPRQYLLYRERGFMPPNATQFYFGTVVHQTLDNAYMHYSGRIEGVREKTLPKDEDIYRYFRNVENGLFARGIRPFAQGPRGGAGADKLNGDEDYNTLKDEIGTERASAFYKIRFFNRVEGNSLYPRVIDTECRIDVNQSNFIITGNVDVIAYTNKNGKKELELWDYKSQKPRDLAENTNDGKDARMQMRIYAHIYNQRTNEMPTRGIIYSLGSIDPKTTPEDHTPEDAIIEILDLANEVEFENSIDEFSETVRQIESSRNTNIWPGPKKDPGASTCDACPKRYDCPHLSNFESKRAYPRHYP